MKRVFALLVLAGLTVFSLGNPVKGGLVQGSRPGRAATDRDSGTPALVSQLPRFPGEETPESIFGMAFDGKEFWVAPNSLRNGIVKFNPATSEWRRELFETKVFNPASPNFGRPGGICFVDGKLWIGDSYGEAFGLFDPVNNGFERLFRGRLKESPVSQSFSAFAFDGTSLWAAWHWYNYSLPTTETQCLLKINPETGAILAEFPLPAGRPNDGSHGLAWDGKRLWHIKGNVLSAIDPSDGRVSKKFIFDGIKRGMALAWAEGALWIAEFDGKLWRFAPSN